MKRSDFFFGTGTVVYWELDRLDAHEPITRQLDGLHEDLAQVEFPNGLVLDIGWYPAHSADGAFRVCVVREADWDNPAFERKCRDVDALLIAVAEGTGHAEEVTGPVV